MMDLYPFGSLDRDREGRKDEFRPAAYGTLFEEKYLFLTLFVRITAFLPPALIYRVKRPLCKRLAAGSSQ